MIVDCDECAVRGDACGDCVMTVLLGQPGMPAPRPGLDRDGPRRIKLEQAERDAMEVLADSGLVPRLRLVSSAIPDPSDASETRPGDGPRHAAG